MSIGFDLGDLVGKIYRYVHDQRSKWKYETRKEHLSMRKTLERNGTLERFLLSYYEELSKDFYNAGHWQYAIAVPSSWRKLLPIDSVLGSLDIYNQKEIDIDMERISEVAITAWCNDLSQRISTQKDLETSMEGPDKSWMERSFFPGRTFALEKIDAHNEGIEMSHYVSDYYSYISTCEYLSYELIEQFRRYETDDGTFQELSLPVRDELGSGEKIYDFQIRSAKVGINVFLVGHLNKDLCCILVKRDETVAEFPGRYGVVPAGTFAPRGPSVKEWYSIQLSVFSELVEECVRGVEDIEKRRTMDTEWLFQQYGYLDKLRASLSNGRSKLVFTAVGVDLLAAKPEVCCTLYLGDSLFSELYRGKLNFETKHADRYRLNDEYLLKLIRPGRVVPGAAVSVIEGLRFCEDELGADTILSKIFS